jgi:hypothetical protein
LAALVVVLAQAEQRGAAFQTLRDLAEDRERPATGLVLRLIHLGYGLTGAPQAQQALLAQFAAIDAKARLHAGDYTDGWYAAEGLRELGWQHCTEATINRLLDMLAMPQARNRMWSLYILSRWGDVEVIPVVRDNHARLVAAVKAGLQQSQSQRLAAISADAVWLWRSIMPTDEMVALLLQLLGIGAGGALPPEAEIGKHLYPRKRALVALSKVAPIDGALRPTLRAYRDRLSQLSLPQQHERERRGLLETLDRALIG